MSYTLYQRCGQRFVRGEIRNLTFGLDAEALSEREPV